MTCWSVLLSLGCAASAQVFPAVTPAPAGPYHIRGNRIIDSKGRPYLIRSTNLPPVTLNRLNRPPDHPRNFGPFSGTTFITIRQRLNMNAIRLHVDAYAYQADERFRARVQEIIRDANRFELLVILDSACGDAAFWANFKENPNLFFAISSIADLDAIRAAGATQPVIAPQRVGDPNAIYEVPLSYASLQLDLEKLNADVPLLASGLDPQLDHVGPECQAFPGDPGNASKLLNDILDRFDQREISWTISTLEPGRLIDAYGGYDWTKLDDGWTCGQPSYFAGIGILVLSHLWGANSHGVLTVNQPAGGLIIARGANASTYGRTLALKEARASGFPLPVKLSNLSIRVTDSRGVSRPAAMSWTGGGWSVINFVIPAESATGPAEVAVLRTDGSKSSSRIIIADAAPALWTATYDGRGPVIGQVTQRFSSGRTAEFPTWKCEPGVYVVDGCRTVPIPFARGAITSVQLDGTGFRYAKSVKVIVDGVSVPVEKFAPVPQSSRDQVTFRLPDTLIGRGEVDLYMTAEGILSNVVRINVGPGHALPGTSSR
jgi:uncharacterized protein (TIGR03437 family)